MTIHTTGPKAMERFLVVKTDLREQEEPCGIGGVFWIGRRSGVLGSSIFELFGVWPSMVGGGDWLLVFGIVDGEEEREVGFLTLHGEKVCTNCIVHVFGMID